MADSILIVYEERIEVASFGLVEFIDSSIAITHVAESLKIRKFTSCCQHIKLNSSFIVFVQLFIFSAFEVLLS
jgi:hypothetical protein